jgi:hypothetical protein
MKGTWKQVVKASRELSGSEREEILAKLDRIAGSKQSLNVDLDSPELVGAFIFKETSEGQEYWWNLARRLEDEPAPPLTNSFERPFENQSKFERVVAGSLKLGTFEKVGILRSLERIRVHREADYIPELAVDSFPAFSIAGTPEGEQFWDDVVLKIRDGFRYDGGIR